MVLLRALLVWLLIVFAEIVHGIVRGVFLVPHVGQFRTNDKATQSAKSELPKRGEWGIWIEGNYVTELTSQST